MPDSRSVDASGDVVSGKSTARSHWSFWIIGLRIQGRTWLPFASAQEARRVLCVYRVLTGRDGDRGPNAWPGGLDLRGFSRNLGGNADVAGRSRFPALVFEACGEQGLAELAAGPGFEGTRGQYGLSAGQWSSIFLYIR